MFKVAKSLCGAVLLLSFATPAQAQDKLAQCAWLAHVYNRCAPNVRFTPGQNLFEFLRLGRSAPCDDGKVLTIRERILKTGDVASMLSQPYTPGRMPLPETRMDYSPGAIRNMDLARSVYGATAQEVMKNLVNVSFLGQRVLFTKQNGAAYQLSLVDAELRSLYALGTDTHLAAFLRPFFAGKCSPNDRCFLRNYTYDWRFVKGSTKLSNHSFGTAIDLEPASGPEYWLWDVEDIVRDGRAKFAPGENASHYDPDDVLNFVPKSNPTYPAALVDVFEKHGFIWGGKWFRYDIMHFEFRPEFFPGVELACGPPS